MYRLEDELETWKRLDPKSRIPYEVSDQGRVRCTEHHPETPGLPVPYRRGRGGYNYVDIRVKDRVRELDITTPVHRLVAIAFLGFKELPVRHKNKIRFDNRPSNLEYSKPTKVWLEKYRVSIGLPPKPLHHRKVDPEKFKLFLKWKDMMNKSELARFLRLPRSTVYYLFERTKYQKLGKDRRSKPRRCIDALCPCIMHGPR